MSAAKLLLLSRFSHVQLCVTPWTGAYQAPLSMGFSRQEYWSGVPLPSPICIWPSKSPQFCLYFSGTGANVNSWFIDNVIIYAAKKNKYGNIEDVDEGGFVASRSHILSLKGPNAGSVTKFSTLRRSRNRYARVVEARQKRWWQFWK